MNSVKVFFYEAFKEEVRELARFIGDRFSYETTSKTIQESGHTAPPARVISIRTQSVIPSAWAAGLDGVLSRSTGYDHLNAFLARTGSNPACGFLEEYATRAVAEQAILLLLSLFRKLPRQLAQMKTFGRDGLTGAELSGKRLLVVGVGRIGREVVQLGSALGMDVHGVDIVRRFPDVSYQPPEEGLRWADAVVCAMNLTRENRGYFSEELLLNAKRGIVLVNIARGELTPTSALLRLMEAGHLGGVGLDVFEDESSLAVDLRRGNPAAGSRAEELLKLSAYPNVILTPHNAFNTQEALTRKARFTVDELLHFFKEHTFRQMVRAMNNEQ